MKSVLLIPAILLVFGSACLNAAPIVLAAPQGYAPGVPFTFTVSLPAVTNLGAYNIDILLSSDSGIAGVDYFFDLTGTHAAASGYVFPTSDLFFAATNVDSPTTDRLTLTDLNLVGVDVLSEVNSAIAVATVSTRSAFDGILSLTIGTDFLILDTPDLIPTPVAEFATIQADTLVFGSIGLLAVPEPGLWSGLAVAGLAIGFRRSRIQPYGGDATP